jgi:hypothetical protein
VISNAHSASSYPSSRASGFGLRYSIFEATFDAILPSQPTIYDLRAPLRLSVAAGIIKSEVSELDYEAIWERLEEAYQRCDTAESFLQEILRIWTEYGIINGELYCALEKVV